MNNMYDYYNYMNNLDNYNNGLNNQKLNNNDLFNTMGLNNMNIMSNMNSMNGSSNILEPYTGFIRGNLFDNLYDQYKNYRLMELKGKNERENYLLQIQALGFASNDLGLYLDLYPNDMNALNLFRNYEMKKEELCKMYEKKYGPLERDYYNVNNWKWDNSPWPWESDK